MVLAQHIADIEEQRWPRRRACWGVGGPDRLIVLGDRGHRDQIALWPKQCRQLASKDRSGVDADRVVEPCRHGHGRVAVDDSGLTAVVLSPLVPHRQAELVGLAVGVAV